MSLKRIFGSIIAALTLGVATASAQTASGQAYPAKNVRDLAVCEHRADGRAQGGMKLASKAQRLHV